jgi:hypothetical protein
MCGYVYVSGNAFLWKHLSALNRADLYELSEYGKVIRLYQFFYITVDECIIIIFKPIIRYKMFLGIMKRRIHTFEYQRIRISRK